MQQTYRRTPMPKCGFSKVALQLYWYHISAWVFSCQFAAYFQNTFPKNTSGWLLLRLHWNNCVDFKITASIFLRIWLYICVLHHSKRLGEEGVGSVTVNFDSSSGIVLMLNTNNISLLLKFFTVLEQKAVKEN